jgi:putative isomerase
MGEEELARDIACKFCELVAQGGMAENFDALSGEPLRDRAYTWTASVFLSLASEFLPQK